MTHTIHMQKVKVKNVLPILFSAIYSWLIDDDDEMDSWKDGGDCITSSANTVDKHRLMQYLYTVGNSLNVELALFSVLQC